MTSSTTARYRAHLSRASTQSSLGGKKERTGRCCGMSWCVATRDFRPTACRHNGMHWSCLLNIPTRPSDFTNAFSIGFESGNVVEPRFRGSVAAYFSSCHNVPYGTTMAWICGKRGRNRLESSLAPCDIRAKDLTNAGLRTGDGGIEAAPSAFASLLPDQ